MRKTPSHSSQTQTSFDGETFNGIHFARQSSVPDSMPRNNNLSYTKWFNNQFQNCNLSTANFTGSFFFNNQLSATILARCDLTGTIWSHNTFSGCTFDVRMSQAYLVACQFDATCQLGGTRMRDSLLKNCSFGSTDQTALLRFGTSTFIDTKMEGCLFAHCDLSQADLTSASLINTPFIGCRLPKQQNLGQNVVRNTQEYEYLEVMNRAPISDLFTSPSPHLKSTPPAVTDMTLTPLIHQHTPKEQAEYNEEIDKNRQYIVENLPPFTDLSSPITSIQSAQLKALMQNYVQSQSPSRSHQGEIQMIITHSGTSPSADGLIKPLSAYLNQSSAQGKLNGQGSLVKRLQFFLHRYPPTSEAGRSLKTMLQAVELKALVLQNVSESPKSPRSPLIHMSLMQSPRPPHGHSSLKNTSNKWSAETNIAPLLSDVNDHLHTQETIDPSDPLVKALKEYLAHHSLDTPEAQSLQHTLAGHLGVQLIESPPRASRPS